MARGIKQRPKGRVSSSLNLFLVCMVSLTAVIGGFTWTLHRQSQQTSRAVRNELHDLEKLKSLASNKALRTHIARFRERQPIQGDAIAFDALLTDLAKKHGLQIEQQRHLRLDRSRPGLEESPIILNLIDVELEVLTRYLYELEETWIGAKIKECQLDWRPKTALWSATVKVSVLRARA